MAPWRVLIAMDSAMRDVHQTIDDTQLSPENFRDVTVRKAPRAASGDLHWDCFRVLAGEILSSRTFTDILDAGCATAFCLDVGDHRGDAVDGEQLPISSLSRPLGRKNFHFSLGDLTKPIAGSCDLIACIEVLCRMPEADAAVAIGNICQAAPRILFSMSADDPDGSAQENGRPPIHWLRKFAECGFAPVASVDMTFIHPWALALARSPRANQDDWLLVHAELTEARIASWQNGEALNKELAEARRNLRAAVDSLATRHAALSPKKPRIKLLERFSRFQRRLQFVRQSIFFDPDWYREKNGDIPTGVDPAVHYLTTGCKEGRDPGPAFSSVGYIKANPDVVGAGYDPLVHFERYGKWEGRPMALAFRGADRLVFERLLRPPKKVRWSKKNPLPERTATYQDWIAQCDALTDEDRDAIRAHVATLANKPLISVVMPVYETPEALLREALDSVRAQLYSNWELCIADDASPSPHVATVLTDYAARDSRIRFMRRDANGHISAATNSALELARGEFVALMDHDDLLAEKALYEVAVELNRRPDADLIYSDEDRIDANGLRHSPYFKTDWNPELFLCHNMISHLGVYRRTLVDQVGGLRLGLEGSQDYDLALRVSRATTPDRIRHIAAILYHWRGAQEKPSFSEGQFKRCVDAARRAKIDHLRASGDGSIVEPHPLLPQWDRVRRPVPSPAPLVSLIVPTRNRADLLRPCVDGLLRRTDYPNLEIIVIDHDSEEPETLALLREVSQDPRVRIMLYRGAFNYSDMNNKAAAIARGDLLGFINNDVDVIDSGWLGEMVALASRPEYGAVGAKLLYPDGKVQHAGVVLGAGGVAGHLHLGEGASHSGYFGRLCLPSNVSAVTGACLIVRKSIFHEVGGLNATDLTVAFNDVDFCLKVAAAGYLNVWTPFALLYHHESPSRKKDTEPEKAARFRREVLYMQRTWGEVLESDPFYNANFSLADARFELAAPARRAKPWGN
jgi:GT2 family glycosyltransferase